MIEQMGESSDEKMREYVKDAMGQDFWGGGTRQKRGRRGPA